MDNPTPLFDMVLFGGTGDLAMRKLIPALYHAHTAALLHPEGRIWALGRRDVGREGYLAQLQHEAVAHIRSGWNDAAWESFCKRIHYLQLDAQNPADFARLAGTLNAPESGSEIICYLSTAPTLFIPICQHLAQAGLNSHNVRIVLEKPLGNDLASSNAINDAVAQYFSEAQTYRIDHYLGKESVQNLLAIRFANVLFEPLWQRQWIDHVQITIAESLGVAGRADFYDGTGALRDMVQNHLLQLLCMVAMEPPACLDADAVRDEKLKVLHALKPWSPETVAENVVRGQYRAGAVDGTAVAGYLEEDDVARGSRTETFVALKTEIQNWRWAGVPFFLRTGKRMQEKLAEIVVQFRQVPLQLFPAVGGSPTPNRLVIRLQPEEDIRLYLQAKRPGSDLSVEPTYLTLDFFDVFDGRRAEAYERLLLDVINGKLGLFMRRDELVAAWEWVSPIMAYWQHRASTPKPYTAGTWGPSAAAALLARDNAVWHEEM